MPTAKKAATTTRKAPAKALASKRPARSRSAAPKTPPVRSVTASVEADLAAVAKQDKALATGALAALALSMARQLDDPGNSATSKSMCARVLLDTMSRLRELTPEAEEADGVDDLQKRRQKRIEGQGRPA